LRPEGSNLTLREDKKKGTYVEHLKEEIVVSPEHVLHVINSGEAHRHVASTDYNLISSRSHTIFRMIIESNAIDDTQGTSILVSSLTLIDLAGSEKVVSTSLMRRREGAYINKSLLTLGTIVSKLSERKKGEKIGYLPYRDSKLTRVLESSLSGNSRIAIIATINPAWLNFEESNNTLKFATRAKKVTNKATQSTIENDKVLITKYKKEIEELKSKLEVAQELEQRLKDLEEKQNQTESQQLEELRNELAEQESLRVSLEEKIKHLTKLILVSSSLAPSPDKRNRAKTGTLMGIEFNLGRTRGLTNVRKSVGADDEEGNKEEPPKGPEALERINEALNIKVEALQQQAEWRDKQIAKLQREIKEKDEKFQALLNTQLSQVNKEQLDKFKAALKDQFEKEVEWLRSTIQEKENQLEVQKAENRLLNEKFLQVSNKK